MGAFISLQQFSGQGDYGHNRWKTLCFQVHLVTCWHLPVFFHRNLKYILCILLKLISKFPWSLELQQVASQTRPVQCHKCTLDFSNSLSLGSLHIQLFSLRIAAFLPCQIPTPHCGTIIFCCWKSSMKVVTFGFGARDNFVD